MWNLKQKCQEIFIEWTVSPESFQMYFEEKCQEEESTWPVLSQKWEKNKAPNILELTLSITKVNISLILFEKYTRNIYYKPGTLLDVSILYWKKLVQFMPLWSF